MIHGRTVSERFRGKADWDALAAVKARFPAATIIGSGDVFDPVAAVELMKRTGLDGFVVARGAIGNPWIFRDLRCVWEGRPVPPRRSWPSSGRSCSSTSTAYLQGYPEQVGDRLFPQVHDLLCPASPQTQAGGAAI